MPEINTKQKIYKVIFETDTPLGKRFDIVLIYAIVLSVIAVMLDSIAHIHNQYGHWLFRIEWFFTLLFSFEYLLRIYSSPKPLKYIFSFYGIVDLVSIIPSYLALVIPEASYWLVVRLLRVLRIFRVLKMVRYLSEANLLLRSINQSRRKIMVFFSAVLVLSIIFGSMMFLVEGPEHGFTSIPKSIYWTIVTITTVGYGDITPQTIFGQMIATMAMLIGYSIIAIPTGILTVEISSEMKKDAHNRVCYHCARGGHYREAKYCYHCGVQLADND